MLLTPVKLTVTNKYIKTIKKENLLFTFVLPDRYIILQPSILLIYHYYFIKFVYT